MTLCWLEWYVDLLKGWAISLIILPLKSSLVQLFPGASPSTRLLSA